MTALATRLLDRLLPTVAVVGATWLVVQIRVLVDQAVEPLVWTARCLTRLRIRVVDRVAVSLLATAAAVSLS